MKLSRLSGRKVCERVKLKGLLWRGKHMHARILFGSPRNLPPSNEARVLLGLVTSTKLDASAVKRNRMRRRCREAVRVSLLTHEVPATAQLIVLPRSSSLTTPFGELLSDAEKLLHFLSTPPREQLRPLQAIHP